MQGNGMKYVVARSYHYILGVGAIGLFLFLGLLFMAAPHSQSEDPAQGISMSISYTEPTAQLGAMTVYSQPNINFTANNVRILGADIWKSDHPRYMMAVHYADYNSDRTERRFVFVVRSSTGVPWIVADSPVRDPNGTSLGTNETIWFTFDVDEALLRTNPKIRGSWFTEVATSTIEIGITDQRQIHVDGAEGSPESKSAALTLLTKVEDIRVFLP